MSHKIQTVKYRRIVNLGRYGFNCREQRTDISSPANQALIAEMAVNGWAERFRPFVLEDVENHYPFDTDEAELLYGYRKSLLEVVTEENEYRNGKWAGLMNKPADDPERVVFLALYGDDEGKGPHRVTVKDILLLVSGNQRDAVAYPAAMLKRASGWTDNSTEPATVHKPESIPSDIQVESFVSSSAREVMDVQTRDNTLATVQNKLTVRDYILIVIRMLRGRPTLTENSFKSEVGLSGESGSDVNAAKAGFAFAKLAYRVMKRVRIDLIQLTKPISKEDPNYDQYIDPGLLKATGGDDYDVRAILRSIDLNPSLNWENNAPHGTTQQTIKRNKGDSSVLKGWEAVCWNRQKPMSDDDIVAWVDSCRRKNDPKRVTTKTEVADAAKEFAASAANMSDGVLKDFINAKLSGKNTDPVVDLVESNSKAFNATGRIVKTDVEYVSQMERLASAVEAKIVTMDMLRVFIDNAEQAALKAVENATKKAGKAK